MESLAKLGIDPGGILIYLVNFGLLWAVLAYFVFPKIIRLIDDRRGQIESNLSTAERIQAELDDTLAQAKAEKAELNERVATELANIEKTIATERRQLLQEIEAKRTEMVEEATALIKEERKQLLAGAEEQTKELIQRVLIRILGENVDPQDVSTSIKAVWEDTKKEVAK